VSLGDRAIDLRADALEQVERIAELDARVLAGDRRILERVQEVEGLRTRGESAAVIEQAKGVLMATLRCSADAAFAVLVAQSQTENRKLRDVAADLVGLQDRRS
jgi:hypothetical protein